MNDPVVDASRPGVWSAVLNGRAERWMRPSSRSSAVRTWSDVGVAEVTAAAVLGAGAAGGVLGVAAGVCIRRLLARIPRGMVLRSGPAEVACGLLWAVGAAVSAGTPRLPLVLLAGVLAVALGAVDLAHHRLPDALTMPAIPLAGVVVLATWMVAPDAGSPLRAAICALAMFAVFAIIARVSPRSMGRGDVKLVPSLGLLTGFLSVATAVVGLVLAFALGALAALVGMAAGRLRLTSAIPFGPFLLAGSWLALTFPTLTVAVTG